MVECDRRRCRDKNAGRQVRTGIDTPGKTTLGSQTISIDATAYNYAVGAVTSPITLNLGIVHTGDIVNQAITVGNSAPAGAFSEALDAQFGTPTGAATTNGGQINLLAAGGSNNSAMVVGINTLTAGTVSGSVNVNLQSDGQGSSGLGKTTLSPITINVSAQVNNFASALVLLGAHSAGVNLTENSATVYTLDLGTTSLNGGNLAAALGIENSATGPADTLAGNFNTSNASAFGLSGFSNFNNIGAGGANNLPNITLSDSASGTFTGVITLNPFSQNGSGYNGALNPITIDVNGTVTATPEPTSLGLLAIAGLGMLGLKRRRNSGRAA